MNRLQSALGLLGVSQLLSSPPNASDLQARCTPDALQLPEFRGAEVLGIQASPALDYFSKVAQSTYDFCNVTVTYTHPGWDDTINLHVWLPLQGWNGRFLGTGGGAWSTGYGAIAMEDPDYRGFTTAFTDGGHVHDNSLSADPTWAHSSPGNVNWHLLQDFASASLYDLSVIGKAVTAAFYQEEPHHSYFSGCSTGGRQGLLLAQRYPHAFDGIMASAPAIHWATFLVAVYWTQQVMNRLGYHPPPCEVRAFVQRAIAACDGLDGVQDGIVSMPGLCEFDPYSLVGQEFSCEGENRTFTEKGAAVVESAWKGPSNTTARQRWYGFNPDARIGVISAATKCDDSGECKSAAVTIYREWIRYFVLKDLDRDLSVMTDAEYFTIMHASRNEYDSVISAIDQDLSAFRDAGGKMLTWHGLADAAIPPNGTVQYYDSVLNFDPAAANYYRFFEAPGVAHCAGGPGPEPSDEMAQLVDWVEKGVAPEVLITGEKNGVSRNLCPYPLQQVYVGGDPKKAESFACHER